MSSPGDTVKRGDLVACRRHRQGRDRGRDLRGRRDQTSCSWPRARACRSEPCSRRSHRRVSAGAGRGPRRPAAGAATIAGRRRSGGRSSPGGRAAVSCRAPPVPRTSRRATGCASRRSPAAPREELGVDLSADRRQRAAGAIMKADVERAAATGSARAAPQRSRYPRLPLSAPPSGGTTALPAARRHGAGWPRSGNAHQAAMRAAIGALMARSKREIPHYYLERRST